MVLEPGGCLETFREVFAGVAFLLEIGYEKFRDCWVIINEQEFGGIPGINFLISSITSKCRLCWPLNL